MDSHKLRTACHFLTAIFLPKLSVADKMQVLETVWPRLYQNPADVQSPEWHEIVFAERTRRLESGEAIVASWADAKSRLMKLGE